MLTMRARGYEEIHKGCFDLCSHILPTTQSFTGALAGSFTDCDMGSEAAAQCGPAQHAQSHRTGKRPGLPASSFLNRSFLINV